jgi:hypothetical protein
MVGRHRRKKSEHDGPTEGSEVLDEHSQESVDPDGVSSRSRRDLLRTAGMATAGAVGGAVLLSTTQAGAADGNNVIIGQPNTGSTETGLSSATAASTGTFAATQTGTAASTSAIAGTATGAQVSQRGVAGIRTGANPSGIGVLGYAATAGDGSNAAGIGLKAQSTQGAAIQIVDDGLTMPPTTGVWVKGSLVVTSGQLWYCFNGGTGSASSWLRLSSVLQTLPQPFRVFDSRAAQPPIPGGGTKGALAFGSGARTIDCSAAVPAGTTSILFNLTIAGTAGSFGALAVTSASVGSAPSSSTINWSGPGQILANGTTSACDNTQKVKIWVVAGTAGVSSTEAILDVIGYTL